MSDYWKDNPPLHIMVAAYLGIGKKSSDIEPLENASEFVPVSTLSPAQFDQILASHGLPIQPAS